MLQNGRLGKRLKQLERYIPFLEIAARELANHKRMTQQFIAFQQLAQGCAAVPQMVDPDRGIGENHGRRK